MTVLVKLSASLRRHMASYDPYQGIEMDARPGLTIADVMADLGIPPEGVKIIMLNGRHAKTEQVINDGDRLSLFPAVGGG
jgi:molybdopterin synthase sulfur carrier subunit